MIPAAFGVLGLYAALLLAAAIGNRRGGGTDAAGRGLAVAYLLVGGLLWCLLAGLTALGYWVGPRFLVHAPFVPIALPLVFLAVAGLKHVGGSLTSRMPTRELCRLERAAKSGNSGAAREIVASGLRLDDPAIGRSLLHAAVDGKYARDVVPVLLEAGADPRDPFLLAKVLESTTTSLEPFLKHGADPNTVLPVGDPLIFKALEGGWTHNVIALLEAGADIGLRDREGWTLLMAHATGRRGFGPGNWVGVAALLEKGADPRAAAPDGRTLAELFAKTPPFQIHPDKLESIRRRLAG